MDFSDRQTALSHDILMSIDKPSRYTGGEPNSVMKDDADIRFVMCFPDVYEIGMSHIGMQILYGMFNSMQDVWCERLFSPWTDLDRIMRERNIPLFSLESQQPVKTADFLGVTLQYEMCYTNILQIFELSGIPFYSADRTEDDPIVIGGGPCVYNPEPIADFFDIFYIGEGEVRYRELFDLYEKAKEEGQQQQGGEPIVLWKAVVGVVVGLAFLLLGGDWLVDGASGLALSMGISQSIVALTIVSIGTSAPELAASVIAAKKGDTGMALGNVVGSVVFNVFYVLGVAAAISPLGMGAHPS